MKIMKRSADFTPELKEKGAGALSKLQIPKKTKLFVDQTMRERENSIGMSIQHHHHNLTFVNSVMYQEKE